MEIQTAFWTTELTHKMESCRHGGIIYLVRKGFLEVFLSCSNIDLNLFTVKAKKTQLQAVKNSQDQCRLLVTT